jgi:hypothetical protein
MVMTRGSLSGFSVVAAAAIFDTRVFLWRLDDEWVAAQQARLREAASAAVVCQVGPGAAVAGPELRQVFVAPDEEPIVDLSISTTAQHLYVVCMEHVSGARLSGPV